MTLLVVRPYRIDLWDHPCTYPGPGMTARRVAVTAADPAGARIFIPAFWGDQLHSEMARWPGALAHGMDVMACSLAKQEAPCGSH